MPEEFPRQTETSPLAQDPNLFTLPRPVVPSALETRNEFLGSAFNRAAGQHLPRVTLQEHQGDRLTVEFEGHPIRQGDPSVKSTLYDILSPEGQRVGYTVVTQPQRGKWYIGDIEAEAHKGYGPATYLAILQSLPEDIGLRTEGVLSDEAVQMWRTMITEGIAKPSSQGGAPTAFETTYN